MNIHSTIQSSIHTPNGESVISFGNINDISYSSDGHYFILLDSGGNLDLIKADTNILEKIIKTDLASFSTRIKTSPSGFKVLLYKLDYPWQGHLIDLKKGNHLHEFEDAVFPNHPFSEDGNYFFYHRYNSAINQTHLLNLKTEEEKIFPRINAQLIDSSNAFWVGIIPDEIDPADPYRTRSVYLNYWSTVDGSLVKSLPLQDVQYNTYDLGGSGIDFTAFGMPDSLLIGIVSDFSRWTGIRYTPYIWNTVNGERLSHYKEFAENEGTAQLQISSDKRWLAVGRISLPSLYDLTKYANTADPSVQLSEYADLVTIHPQSKQIVYREFLNSHFSQNFLLRTLDLETQTIVQEISLRHMPFQDASFSPQGDTFMLDNETNFDIWETAIPWYRQKIDSELRGYGTNQFTTDGRFFLRGLGTTVVMYDTQSWAELGRFKSSTQDNRCFVNISRQNIFLTASGRVHEPGLNNLIRLWNLDTKSMIREFRGHTDSVWYADFSPDGRRIVSASRDGTAKVWDVDSGAIVSDFVGHATGVIYARFFPDGRRVLSADNDHRAYIWDTQTAQIEQTFESIHLPARLSPDGRYLFAGA
ncbi:MAG: WD40 repeat domain-containing protein, partial [bacterium]